MNTIPESVMFILQQLEANGHDAYIVGGAARDLDLGRTPKDWDVATSATPDKVQEVFDKTIPTGVKYGTITVMVGDDMVEVTTYRRDGTYGDGRRPDNVVFSDNIMDDLQRRDFTINAMAYSPLRGWVTVPTAWRDLLGKRIVAVGSVKDRIQEDALRMMRALRLSSQLNFHIDENLYSAIVENAHLINRVSKERIRDELCKILVSAQPFMGLDALAKTSLLAHISPEAHRMVGFPQNKHHKFDVWGHTLKVINYTPHILNLRLLALFHDIGKPLTAKDGSFIGHEDVGAEITKEVMSRLKFSNDRTDYVSHMVRNHMFPIHNADSMGKAGYRRFERRIGESRVWDMIAFKRADVLGTGRYKDEEVSRIVGNFYQKLSEATSGVRRVYNYSKLAVDGNDIMDVCGLKPGPLVGKVLQQLNEIVIDAPELNQREYLIEAAKTICVKLEREVAYA